MRASLSAMEPNFDLMVDQTEGHTILSLSTLNDMIGSGRQRYEGSQMPKHLVKEMAQELGRNNKPKAQLYRGHSCQDSNSEELQEQISSQQSHVDRLTKQLQDSNTENIFLQSSMEAICKNLEASASSTVSSGKTVHELESELRGANKLIMMNKLRMDVLEGMAAKTGGNVGYSGGLQAAEDLPNCLKALRSYDAIREIIRRLSVGDDECSSRGNGSSSSKNSSDIASNASTYDVKELEAQLKEMSVELEQMKSERARMQMELSQKGKQLDIEMQEKAGSSSASRHMLSLQKERDDLQAANVELKRQLREAAPPSGRSDGDSQAAEQLRVAKTRIYLLEHRLEMYESMHKGVANSKVQLDGTQITTGINSILMELQNCTDEIGSLQSEIACDSRDARPESPPTPLTVVRLQGRRGSKEMIEWLTKDASMKTDDSKTPVAPLNITADGCHFQVLSVNDNESSCSSNGAPTVESPSQSATPPWAGGSPRAFMVGAESSNGSSAPEDDGSSAWSVHPSSARPWNQFSAPPRRSSLVSAYPDIVASRRSSQTYLGTGSLIQRAPSQLPCDKSGPTTLTSGQTNTYSRPVTKSSPHMRSQAAPIPRPQATPSSQARPNMAPSPHMRPQASPVSHSRAAVPVPQNPGSRKSSLSPSPEADTGNHFNLFGALFGGSHASSQGPGGKSGIPPKAPTSPKGRSGAKPISTTSLAV